MLNKLYNDRTNNGLLVHHKLRRGRSRQVVRRAAIGPTTSSTTSHDWLDEQPSDATAACASRRSCANPLSPAPANSWRALVAPAATATRSRRGQRQDFVGRTSGSTALAERDRGLAAQRMPDAVYWIEASQRRRWPPRDALGRPDRRRPVAPRGAVRARCPRVVMTSATLATGAGLVRLLQVAHRPDAGRNALPGQPVRLSPPGQADPARRHARPRAATITSTREA